MRYLKKSTIKYANRLTDEQIKELILIYYPNDNIININIDKKDNGVFIEVSIKIVDEEEFDVKDLIIFKDYGFEFYDFYDIDSHEHRKQYRKKMLEYFGEQYAIDFLLGG